MRWALLLAAGLVLCLGAAKPATDATRLARVDEMYQQYRAEFPGVPEVTADTLQVWLADGDVELVDVREAKEREVSVIPGAITEDELTTYLPDHVDQKVVLYCTIGYRSGKLTRDLQKNGINVFNLEGGILSWIHRGGMVEHDGQPTHRVHVYGKKWSLLPASYQAVW